MAPRGGEGLRTPHGCVCVSAYSRAVRMHDGKQRTRGRVLCVCMYSAHPRADSGSSSRQGHKEREMKEPVAHASRSVLERVEGEDPVTMCCMPRAYLHARWQFSVHSSNSPTSSHPHTVFIPDPSQRRALQRRTSRVSR